VKRKSERTTSFQASAVGALATDNIRRMERLPNGKAWPRMDYILAVTVGALLLIGLMMVYSSTFDMAYQWNNGQPAYYLFRQLFSAALGLALLLVLARLDYSHLHHLSIPFMGCVVLLLILVLIFGQERFGATRTFFNGRLQPSELMKLAVVIYIADWLASKGEKIRDVSYGLIPFGVLIGGIAGSLAANATYGLLALGEMRAVALQSGLRAVVVTVLMIPLTMQYGLTGAAWATVVTALVLAYVAWLAVRTGQSRAVRIAGGAVAAVVLAQWIVGPVMVLRTFPLWLATAHNAVAAILLLSVVALLRFVFSPRPTT